MTTIVGNIPKIKLRIKPTTTTSSPPKIKLRLKTNDSPPPTESYILSVDVAIKHLSFCILDGTKIIDWKLIDLLQGSEIKQLCTGIKKAGSTCTNNAKWIDTKNQAYCEIHKTNAPDLRGLNKKLSCRCGALARYISKDNVGYCQTHKTNNAERWYTVDNINDLELRILLFKKLDEFDFSNISTVLIERQPKLATEKMRSLAYAIFDYFIIKIGMRNEPFVVEWIDPKNKLYVYSGPIIECSIKNQYDRNKWFACKYCAWNLLRYNETEYTKFFLENKKQDDLADCYLQGLYYTQKGIKKEMSAQQRNVFTEQNLRKYAGVRPRKPKNIKAKIMLSGIKYYIKKREITQAVLDSLTFYFGNIEIEKLY
jgi:hypothetical protein